MQLETFGRRCTRQPTRSIGWRIKHRRSERERAFLVNAAAPGVIARWAASRGAPLIHFSTDYVFDGTGARAWRELDATGPLSAYGASKLEGENIIRAAGGPHLIIRTSWVYAAKGANFLRTIARLARERTELRIVADQIGAPTPAAVIATAVTQILLTSQANVPSAFSRASGLVHLAASGETSWHGFASAIVAGFRRREVPLLVEKVVPIATVDLPTKARRQANSRLDLDRLRTVFGVTTPVWDAALQPELDRLAEELRQQPSA